MFLPAAKHGAAALLLTAVAIASPQSPTVKVAQGTLAGVSDSAGISSFKGVPFAAPPVGALRWKPPASALPWTGTRQATHWGSACMQNLRRDTLPWTHEFMVQNDTSEDCLFLNIWTRNLSAHAHLPVLVFIHGGGFNEGSGGIDIYDGANLAKKGIVVVTINYRLGVFGFLAHPDLTAESPNHSSGNYGLEDQVEALKWIRANIKAFGGDPHRVTIWGQSAGAASVGSLLASPFAKGWFQAAIADSGLQHTTTPTATLIEAEKEGLAFAKAIGATSLNDLRALSADDLQRAPAPSSVHFRPVVDDWVLTQPTQSALENGPDSDVPLITGSQSDDARTFSGPPRSLDDYKHRIAIAYGPLADQVLELYPATDDRTASLASDELTRDRTRVSQWLLATRRSATHTAATYTYYMDEAIPWPQHPEFGAFHTGELPYAFANLDKLDRPWTAKDREVSQVLSTYIVNFTKTGSPNGPTVPHWPKASKDAAVTMELGQAFARIPLANQERQTFWLRVLQIPTPPRN